MTAKLLQAERKKKNLFFFIPSRSLPSPQGNDNANRTENKNNFYLKVSWTVCQGQFNLHAVVIGIGEDAVLLYILYRRPLLQRCLFSVYRQYQKKQRLICHKGKSTD